MRLVFINQPIEGKGKRVGDHLLQLLSRKDDFDHFRAAVAWAKRGGVQPIFDAMLQFRKNGGRIETVVGIDLNGTSIQALRLLRQVAQTVRIFQNANRRFRPTYHPKLYLFSGPAMASVILGSSNLTQGGLYVNYEQNVRLDLDLQNVDDRLVFDSVQAVYQTSANAPNRVSRELTDELLDQLIQRNLLLDEDAAVAPRIRSGDQDTDETKASMAPLFGATEIAGPPAVTRRPTAPRPAGVQAAPAQRSVATPVAAGTEEKTKPARTTTGTVVDCFWKALSWNDVNPHGSPGQIVIPIQFRDIFPQVMATPAYAGRSRGKQLECSFPVVFEDARGQTEAPDARFIIYEPLPKHPRPNTEARFAFHNRPIFDRLHQDDVLVFERLDGSKYIFRIRHVQKGTPEYAKLSPGSGRRKRFGKC